MASDLPPGGAATSTPISSSDSDFAFNSSIFSDRILRIEIIPDLPETKPDTEGCTTLANETRNRKRRRQDIERDDVVGSVEHPEEQILSDQLPEMVEGVGKNQDEEAVATVERSPSDAGVNADRLGDEGACRDDPSRSMDCSTVLKVETIHISAAILAARSPFFFKVTVLFSNGMLESDQRHVTLRNYSSEEAALRDLLNFMYSNTLTVRSPAALLDVLMAADKFEVVSCMRYCGRVLQDLPMTRESALRYLDLPSTVLNAAAVQPLIEAAKQFLAGLYKDITKFHDDILNLPLVGIEAVLSSDDLQVDSEDAVFDFVLKWARAHYPKLEEQREVFGSRLHCLVRFPFMTCKKLAMFLFCEEFDRELVRKLVLGALFLKARAPAYQWRPLASESADFVCRRIVERAYKLRPVKVVEFQLPRQQSIVYLDLKREECTHLFPVDSVRSQAFYLGGQVFYLSAECRKDQQSSLHFFGLFLGMHGTTSERLSVKMEFSARSKRTEDYMRKHRGIATFTGGDVFGCQNLFNIPWTTFMADKSPYFINGILHLRSVLTVKQ